MNFKVITDVDVQMLYGTPMEISLWAFLFYLWALFALFMYVLNALAYLVFCQIKPINQSVNVTHSFLMGHFESCSAFVI